LEREGRAGYNFRRLWTVWRERKGIDEKSNRIEGKREKGQRVMQVGRSLNSKGWGECEELRTEIGVDRGYIISLEEGNRQTREGGGGGDHSVGNVRLL